MRAIVGKNGKAALRERGIVERNPVARAKGARYRGESLGMGTAVMGRTANRQRTTLIILAILGLSIPLVCIGIGLALYIASVAAPQKPTITREEFRTAVIGKTPDEVIKAVGSPDDTQDFSLGPMWYYRHRTRDSITGKTDYGAQVIFRDGVVIRVNY